LDFDFSPPLLSVSYTIQRSLSPKNDLYLATTSNLNYNIAVGDIFIIDYEAEMGLNFVSFTTAIGNIIDKYADCSWQDNCTSTAQGRCVPLADDSGVSDSTGYCRCITPYTYSSDCSVTPTGCELCGTNPCISISIDNTEGQCSCASPLVGTTECLPFIPIPACDGTTIIAVTGDGSYNNTGYYSNNQGCAWLIDISSLPAGANLTFTFTELFLAPHDTLRVYNTAYISPNIIISYHYGQHTLSGRIVYLTAPVSLILIEPDSSYVAQLPSFSWIVNLPSS